MDKQYLSINNVGSELKETFDTLSKSNDKLIGGLESFDTVNDFLHSVDGVLTNTIKGTISYFSTVNVYLDNAVSYKTKTPNIRTMLNARKTLKSYVKDGGKFYKISQLKAPVVLGLDVTLPEIVNILKHNTSYVNGIEETLTGFSDTIDDIINSNKKIDIDIDNGNAILKQTSNIDKELAKVTSNTNLSDRKPVNELVNNFKELETVLEDTLKLGSVYNMEKIEELQELNQNLVNKLDVLYDIVKNDSNVIEKQLLKEFAEYINTLAKFLTAIAFLFYLYFQLANMITAIVKMTELEKRDNSVIDNIAFSIKRGTKGIEHMLKQLTA